MQDSDFGGMTSQKRGWAKPHLIGYMESHDEERLMYKNLNFGNQSSSYSTRDSISALKRMGQAAAFWAMIPGPKMLWQFGELGFPYSINTCSDGTVNNNCRLDNKPLVWNNFNDVLKRSLFDVYSNLIRLRLRSNYLTTFTTDKYTIDFSGAVKTMQINDDSLKVVVIGNFDITAKTVLVNFPSNGTWHSYLTKTSINVSGGSSNLTLQPGEYHVYLNKDLSSNLVTAITNPALPVLDTKIQLYPNPVISNATLSYTLASPELVNIDLVSSDGITISRLYSGIKPSGKHSLNINRNDIEQVKINPGVYMIMVKTSKGQKAVKLLFR
jgi:hypothetical protein